MATSGYLDRRRRRYREYNDWSSVVGVVPRPRSLKRWSSRRWEHEDPWCTDYHEHDPKPSKGGPGNVTARDGSRRLDGGRWPRRGKTGYEVWRMGRSLGLARRLGNSTTRRKGGVREGPSCFPVAGRWSRGLRLGLETTAEMGIAARARQGAASNELGAGGGWQAGQTGRQS